MAKYQVAIVRRPEGWRPASLDGVPTEGTDPLQPMADVDDLFVAVRKAVEYNENPSRQSDNQWAVVVEPGAAGRRWSSARLCTPVAYKVMTIWRPDGWEPESPLDVPNCVWKARSEIPSESLTYIRAVATMRALNRQSMDLVGDMWHVLLAVENEPVSQTISYDATGTETTTMVRCLHVVRPETGGRGTCTHCPAHTFPCAQLEWSSLAQTAIDKQIRAL